MSLLGNFLINPPGNLVTGGNLRLQSNVGAYTRWTPLSLSNLTGWWDFSNAASITTTLIGSVTVVTQADDRSSFGRHLTQTNATNQPRYELMTVNGLNAARFDGINDYMDFPAGAAWDSTMSIFMVLKIRASWTNGIVLYGNGAGMSPIQTDTSSGDNWFSTRYAGTALAGVHGLSVNTAYQVTVLANGASTTIRTDRSAGSAGDPGSGTGTAGLLGFPGLSAPMDVCELFISNPPASSTEVTNAEAYLKAKWATA